MYPLIWEAFREWWLWRENFRIEETAAPLPPFVDFDILTNHYYTQNPSIWSPWHIRFAYETGAKCLYPNLPGKLSLVSNHREKGSNYMTTLGTRTVTLQRHHVQHDTGLIHCNQSSCGGVVDTPVPKSFLWSFPFYSRMVHQQYDFSLRRAGRRKYSSDALFVTAQSQSPPDIATSSTMSSSSPKQFATSKDASLCHSDDLAVMKLSERHWHLIADMLESYVEDQHVVLHVEPAFHVNYFTQLGTGSSSFTHQGKVISNILIASNCAEWEQSQVKDDFLRCLLLPDLDDIQSWEQLFSQLQQFSLQLVIVNEVLALQCLKEKLSVMWEVLKNHDFPYLLVLGTCVGAPTGLKLTAPPPDDIITHHSDSSLLPRASLSFSLAEDICSEQMWHDVGAVLYRRVIDDNNNNERNDGYAVMKRHEGQITSRRFRKAFSFLND
jgi:hypothetical protein